MTTWRVVGWADESEWEAVYFNLFYGDRYQIRAALNQISIWRARFAGRIPVAIEATAQLFECFLHEGGSNTMTKRQCMSTALSQFVGLLTERSLKTTGYHTPIHVRGEEMGIPEWIVNLRHEAAHGFVPSFLMLDKGVKFAFEWLKTVHWEKLHEKQIKMTSNDDNNGEDVVSIDRDIVAVLRNCFTKAVKRATPSKTLPELNSIISVKQNGKLRAERLYILQEKPFDPKNEQDFLITIENCIAETRSCEIQTTEFLENETIVIDNPSSWTLFKGDIGGLPIGLMPGQDKTMLWKDLSSDRLEAAENFIDNLPSNDVEKNNYFHEGFSESQIQHFANAIDLL
uniref:ribosomal biogenesis protein LAS1L-like n=1 Tax=Styela clava TaxID=7725 RepID=UPI00193942A9|nr:ribosomal biogenesis protein LAS1L-like [Styela clava]